MQAEFSIIKSAELKAKLPKSYELVVQTIPKVMAAPGQAMLKEFFPSARGAYMLRKFVCVGFH
jgi:hypothetical protein